MDSDAKTLVMLRDHRSVLWNEARKLVEEAVWENRAFTASEEARWQWLNTDLNEIDRRLKQLHYLRGEEWGRVSEAGFPEERRRAFLRIRRLTLEELLS